MGRNYGGLKTNTMEMNYIQGFLCLRLEKSVGSVERDMKESLRRWKDSTVKMKSEK